jgi:outer membrane protein assembly factor BamB
MKRVLIASLIVMCSIYMWAEKAGPLEEIENPGRIVVDESQLYVTDGTAIAIFSLTDLKLVKKIGEKDKGPVEFIHPINLYIQPDGLLVNSRGKIFWFAKNGEFKKELMTPPGTGFFQPMGENFLGRAVSQREESGQVVYVHTYDLYDGHLNKIKEIFRTEISRKPQEFDAYPATLMFLVSDNRAFISGRPEFVIDAYDEKGESLLTIKRPYERLKVTEADQRRYFDILKLRGVSEKLLEYARKNARFAEYFPAIYKFSVADGKVYIMTYRKKGDKSEFFIYDTGGKLIKEAFIPLVGKNALEPFPYTIRSDKVYQVVENLKKEVWELKITPLE